MSLVATKTKTCRVRVYSGKLSRGQAGLQALSCLFASILLSCGTQDKPAGEAEAAEEISARGPELWSIASSVLKGEDDVDLQQQQLMKPLIEEARAAESFAEPDSNYLYASWLAMYYLERTYEEPCPEIMTSFADVLAMMATRQAREGRINWRPNLPPWWSADFLSFGWYTLSFAERMLECVGPHLGAMTFFEGRASEHATATLDWFPYIEAKFLLEDELDSQPEIADVLQHRLKRVDRDIRYLYLVRCRHAISYALTSHLTDRGHVPQLSDPPKLDELLRELDPYISAQDPPVELSPALILTEYNPTTGRFDIALRNPKRE